MIYLRYISASRLGYLQGTLGIYRFQYKYNTAIKALLWFVS